MNAMMSTVGSAGRERSHVVSTFGALARDQRAAEAEARLILAATEPAGRRSGSDYDGVVHSWPAARHYYLGSAGMAPYAATLAESLAAAVADGGLLDRMAP